MHPVPGEVGRVEVVVGVGREITSPVHLICEVIAYAGSLATAKACLLKSLPHIRQGGIVNHGWKGPVFVLRWQP
jgi:hypothetical protein